jgi:hypothetical protein
LSAAKSIVSGEWCIACSRACRARCLTSGDDTPVADDAQRELDDALRSLGLRRGQLEQAKVSDDKTRDLREGYRGAIPLEYQERLRAYNQGVSRARQSDE